MGLIDITCTSCGSTFSGRGVNALCRKCRKKANRTRTNTCNRCGTAFKGMPDTLYCRKCRSLSVRIKPTIIVCDTCGGEMSSMFGETTCADCRKHIRKHNRSCGVCGVAFLAHTYNQILCSDCKRKSCRVESTCVVCGTSFIPKRRHCRCKTCSRHCQSLYVQNSGQGVKYNDAELLGRIKTHILAHGIPTSIESLGKDLGGVTHKVFSARGWTMRHLLDLCDIDTAWIPSTMSMFESAIYQILINIFGAELIVLQKTFKDCLGVGGRPLRFDFFIPTINLIVEADGEQHFDKPGLPHWDQEGTKKHDLIKNNYCLNNNINIIRIRYFVSTAVNAKITTIIKSILPSLGESQEMHCFNCWNGGELLPISSEGSQVIDEQRSTTIPRGSTHKCVEMGSTQTGKAEGEDIVYSAGNP